MVSGLAKTILQGTVQGKRRKGRQKKRWEDNIKEWTGMDLGRGLVDRKLVEAPQFLLLAVPRRLFCFGSLVILDAARCYLWLFTLYINIEIGKNSC